MGVWVNRALFKQLIRADAAKMWRLSDKKLPKLISRLFCRAGFHYVIWADGRPAFCLYCLKQYHPLGINAAIKQAFNQLNISIKFDIKTNSDESDS